MKDGFYPDISFSKYELERLKLIVSSSHESAWIPASLDGLIASKTVHFCGVYSNNCLVSLACYMLRKWNINGQCCDGLSIGVVTTDSNYRNLGHAKTLIAGIEQFARSRKVDFLYLAGIPDFYNKYGFSGFAPKSKFAFNKSVFPKCTGTIINATKDHLGVLADMYNNYCKEISFYPARSLCDWNDLLESLSTTFLFHSPKIVLDKTNTPLAYFCSTPKHPQIIREFVPQIDYKSVCTSLSLIANTPEYSQLNQIEIFAPSRGPVWHAAANILGADFFCFLRPNASNMVKWLQNSNLSKHFDYNFLFQGDIL